MRQFNGLTPEEHEALALLSEECGEVVQAVGKIMRHGLESFRAGRPTNREELESEVADLHCCIRILIREGVLTKEGITAKRAEKIRKVRSRPGVLHHIDPL